MRVYNSYHRALFVQGHENNGVICVGADDPSSGALVEALEDIRAWNLTQAWSTLDPGGRLVKIRAELSAEGLAEAARVSAEA
jgi:hypothetical protein